MEKQQILKEYIEIDTIQAFLSALKQYLDFEIVGSIHQSFKRVEEKLNAMVKACFSKNTNPQTTDELFGNEKFEFGAFPSSKSVQVPIQIKISSYMSHNTFHKESSIERIKGVTAHDTLTIDKRALPIVSKILFKGEQATQITPEELQKNYIRKNKNLKPLIQYAKEGTAEPYFLVYVILKFRVNIGAFLHVLTKFMPYKEEAKLMDADPFQNSIGSKLALAIQKSIQANWKKKSIPVLQSLLSHELTHAIQNKRIATQNIDKYKNKEYQYHMAKNSKRRNILYFSRRHEINAYAMQTGLAFIRNGVKLEDLKNKDSYDLYGLLYKSGPPSAKSWGLWYTTNKKMDKKFKHQFWKEVIHHMNRNIKLKEVIGEQYEFILSDKSPETFTIKNRFNDSIMFEVEAESLKDAVEQLVKQGADLRGASLRGAYLDEANLEGANLREAYLAYANLAYANLERANLERANLSYANLYRANLRGANLEGVKLIEAELEGANLVGENLAYANIERANLERANLSYANLYRANLEGANLEGAKLVGTNLEGAKLVGTIGLNINENYEFIINDKPKGTFIIKHCFNDSIMFEVEAESLKDAVEQLVKQGAKLEVANLERANLEGATLEGAKLVGANLEGANLREAYLARADLEGANLREANLAEANLIRANLRGSNLERANLIRANLIRANLRGSNLERANLIGANLERATLEGAKLVGANLEGSNLDEANLEGANLRRAHITYANLAYANLERANLRRAKLVGTNLEGAKLVGTIGLNINENYEFILNEKEQHWKVSFLTVKVHGDLDKHSFQSFIYKRDIIDVKNYPNDYHSVYFGNEKYAISFLEYLETYWKYSTDRTIKPVNEIGD